MILLEIITLRVIGLVDVLGVRNIGKLWKNPLPEI